MFNKRKKRIQVEQEQAYINNSRVSKLNFEVNYPFNETWNIKHNGKPEQVTSFFRQLNGPEHVKVMKIIVMLAGH